jgi:long-chain acyl-CoA synthetase
MRRRIRKSLGLSEAANIFTGAAPTSVELLQWFKKIGINIQEGYGLTENWTYSHITKRDHIKIGYAGQPFPGVEVKLGEDNEVLIRHEGLMIGYYKEPEKTREAFTEDGFLRTGDTGAIEKDHFLKITGRIKEIFKTSKGNYVAPSHIEMKLAGNSIVNLACVIGCGMPQPIALITLSETGKKLSAEELELQIKDMEHEISLSLDVYERITRIVISKDEWSVENGMLTATFKIKRNEVERKYAQLYSIEN